MRRLILVTLLVLVGSMVVVGSATAAEPPQVGTTLPGEELVTTSSVTVWRSSPSPTAVPEPAHYVDEGLLSYYYWGTGGVAQANGYDVRITVTGRSWSQVVGGPPEEFDAAASIYRRQNRGINVLDVQIDLVRLLAGSTLSERSRTSIPRNSAYYGNPVRDNTPPICVSPFSTGVYKGEVTASWRDTVNPHPDNLHREKKLSGWSRARYATIAC